MFFKRTLASLVLFLFTLEPSIINSYLIENKSYLLFRSEPETKLKVTEPTVAFNNERRDLNNIIYSIAKKYQDKGFNEERGIEVPWVGKKSNVCARFVTHVLYDAGLKGFKYKKEGLCPTEQIEDLEMVMKSKKFTKINLTSLIPGDIVLLSSKKDVYQHAAIFSHYDSSGSIYVFGDSGGTPTRSLPVALKNYPVKKTQEEDIYFFKAYRTPKE